MRRAVVMVALVVAALVPWRAEVAAETAAVPVNNAAVPLTVEQPRINLGDVKSGAEAVATFVFHNQGAADVRILKAKPS